MIRDSLKSGGKILVCGNGGSAADAQHFVAEFIGKLDHVMREALPAICLNTNTSTLTALANDYGYETVFARPVQALGNQNDVLVGITTSGNSANILNAFKTGKEKGIKTIALTGKGGGKIKSLSDICILAEGNETYTIQNQHIAIIHLICALVEQELEK